MTSQLKRNADGCFDCDEPLFKFGATVDTRLFIEFIGEKPYYGHQHGCNFTQHVRKFQTSENLKAIAAFRIGYKERIIAGLSPLEAVELEYVEGGLISARQFALMGGKRAVYLSAYQYYQRRFSQSL